MKVTIRERLYPSSFERSGLEIKPQYCALLSLDLIELLNEQLAKEIWWERGLAFIKIVSHDLSVLFDR